MQPEMQIEDVEVMVESVSDREDPDDGDQYEFDPEDEY